MLVQILAGVTIIKYQTRFRYSLFFCLFYISRWHRSAEKLNANQCECGGIHTAMPPFRKLRIALQFILRQDCSNC